MNFPGFVFLWKWKKTIVILDRGIHFSSQVVWMEPLQQIILQWAWQVYFIRDKCILVFACLSYHSFSYIHLAPRLHDVPFILFKQISCPSFTCNYSDCYTMYNNENTSCTTGGYCQVGGAKTQKSEVFSLTNYNKIS